MVGLGGTPGTCQGSGTSLITVLQHWAASQEPQGFANNEGQGSKQARADAAACAQLSVLRQGLRSSGPCCSVLCTGGLLGQHGQ